MVGFEINVIGSIVAAITAMVIGFIWFGPLFGKKWAELSGMKTSEAEMKKEMPKGAVLGLITAFIQAAILSAFIVGLGAAAIGDALAVGFLAWLGFSATLQFGAVIWEKQPMQLFIIHTAECLIVLLVQAAILVSIM